MALAGPQLRLPLERGRNLGLQAASSPWGHRGRRWGLCQGQGGGHREGEQTGSPNGGLRRVKHGVLVN